MTRSRRNTDRHIRLLICAQAVAMLVTACAGSSAGGAVQGAEYAEWIGQPPKGCAVGSSGPTLNPSRAIRKARESATLGLATSKLGVDIATISGSDQSRSYELTTQAMSGRVAGTLIVSLWADVEGARTRRADVREVFALACEADASPPSLPSPSYPDWIVDPARSGDGVCAVGIGGPTLDPDDQPAATLRDAQRTLAESLESDVEKRIFDDGRGLVKIASEIQPSEAAIRRAAAVEDLAEEWLDESGRGPLRMPGILYGLVCAEN